MKTKRLDKYITSSISAIESIHFIVFINILNTFTSVNFLVLESCHILATIARVNIFS